MDIGLEEVEQAASLVQQAVHPDALTIFGATFDETMDDEIRVTVIATGFDKNPADELPKIGTFAKPPVQLEGQEKDEQPKMCIRDRQYGPLPGRGPGYFEGVST